MKQIYLYFDKMKYYIIELLKLPKELDIYFCRENNILKKFIGKIAWR